VARPAAGAPGQRARLRVLRANDTEDAAHVARLDGIDRASGSGDLWRRDEGAGTK
jgi:hypothetical protein